MFFDCVVSVVSAFKDHSLMKELRNHFVEVKASITKPWCLVGNFNETIFPSYRRGGTTESFQGLYKCLWFSWITFNGKWFTWLRGNSASRIDRAFVSPKWLNKLLSFSLCGLAIYVFHHRPVHLMLDKTNWRPKPFRFINCWRMRSDFKRGIQDFQGSTMDSVSGGGKVMIGIPTIFYFIVLPT
jgi:hypothetical protein